MGVMQQFAGPWIDSTDCVPCDVEELTAIEVQEIETQTVTPEQITGPRTQVVEMCIAENVCRAFRATYIFDSVEQAQDFFNNAPQDVDELLKNYQAQINGDQFVVINNPDEPYVQCLPFEVRNGAVQFDTERMASLEMYGDTEKNFDHRTRSCGMRNRW